MYRSFLARRHPLLSNLGRHARRFVARLGGGADQTISRSYTSSEDETDSDVDRPEAGHRRQHLYVVLDDWKKGFSIHKLDLNGGSDGDDLTLRAPVHRQATGDRYWNFAAVGSKIVAAGRIKSNEDDYVKLVYDTELAGLSIVPWLPAALHGCWSLATAAGNGLYVFEDMSNVDGQYNGGMHLLEDAPAPADDKYGEAFWWGTKDHWSWSSVPTPLPFAARLLESVAVYPDQGGVFVSVGEWSSVVDTDGDMVLGDDGWHPDGDNGKGLVRTSRTFSYDTGTREWTRHGGDDWDLPFHGQARYDAELDAWVGLRKLHKPYNRWTDGSLCSCDVAVASPDGSPVQPAWKLCAEGLHFRTNARLVYLGSSNYCLVDFMPCGRFKSGRCANVGNKSVIRVDTFRLKYGKKGELIVTDRRPTRSYHFSSFYETSRVHAFWM